MMFVLLMTPSKRRALQSLLFFVAENIYSSDREDNPNYRSQFDQSVIELLRTLSIALSATFTFLAIFSIFPFVTYIVRHEIQIPLPVLFPFTELESTTGLVINFSSQVFALFFGAMANISIELIQFMLKNSVWAITVAICLSIDEFSTIFETRDFNETDRLMDQHFRNILIQIQDLDRFVNILVCFREFLFEIWTSFLVTY